MPGSIPDSSQPVLTARRPGSLLVFFLAAYALMWACFFTVAGARIPANTLLGALLLYLGTFAPSLAALWLTERTEGEAGVRGLLARVAQGRVGWQWYLFAAGYIVTLKLTVALIYRMATGGWPRFGTDPWYLMLGAVLISTPVQAGEEIGWRGYALPRLAARFGWAWASIFLGLIWAFWHLPQFFIREADTYGQSFLIFVLQVTAISVAMAWLYLRTNGSLLLTMLLHAAVNNTKDIVPSSLPGGSKIFGLNASPVAWITVTLLWICAAYFLARMKKGNWQLAIGN